MKASRILLCSLAVFLAACGDKEVGTPAATAAPSAASASSASAPPAAGETPTTPEANHELIDVASFFNGGFPYTLDKHFDSSRIAEQIRMISHGRSTNSLSDAYKGDSENTKLFYALAAPATIEVFRISGGDEQYYIPRRIAFAVSMSPADDFQTVAEFDVPESAVARASYDFSIPVRQKISGRYVRITLSGAKQGRYQLSRFSAQGRFDQPVELREDFSGIYSMTGQRDSASPANNAMVEQQKGTSYSPFLILHQNGSQISGCYVYSSHNGGGGGRFLLQNVTEVLGAFTGGVENNVFRFTRTYAPDDGQTQGGMALFPVAENITKG
ncbi:MAG: hypothetical protein LBF51_01410, partial [Zoogloeaceae bacterium]|nr:hypothetical protein [Zoogloeaceae bacterium]